MHLSAGYDVSVQDMRTCLLVLLTVVVVAETLQTQDLNLKSLLYMRLDVTPRDVMTRSSLIDCAVTCRLTSWCVSANLLPDRRTCQLLTEEVSDDDESLLPADGWTYLREYVGFAGHQHFVLNPELS